MKTKFFVALAAFVLSFTACQKDNDDDNGGGNAETDYQPVTAGSTWQYNSTTGSYTETATGTDTTIEGEKYYAIDNSENERRYVSKSGIVYKTYGFVEELQQSLQLTYLKDAAVGTTWDEPETVTYGSFTIPVVFKYTITSRDSDKIVNNKTYEDVIAVDVAVSANHLLLGGNRTVATGQQFYAKGVGSILSTFNFAVEELDIEVSDSTYLVTSDIK